MSDEINMRLFRAAARGSLDHALLAIEAGAEINARDYNNHTALHIAKSRNQLELADRHDAGRRMRCIRVGGKIDLQSQQS